MRRVSTTAAGDLANLLGDAVGRNVVVLRRSTGAPGSRDSARFDSLSCVTVSTNGGRRKGKAYETAFGECSPDRTGIVAVGEDVLGLRGMSQRERRKQEQRMYGQNRVSCVDERRSARLALESIDNELQRERVAGLRDLLGRVLVVVEGRIDREQSGGESVLDHEVLGHLEEHLRPHFSNRMDAVVGGLIERLVRILVDRLHRKKYESQLCSTEMDKKERRRE